VIAPDATAAMLLLMLAILVRAWPLQRGSRLKSSLQ
jgi:hypothetical protein